MKYIIDIPDDRIGDFVGSTHLLMPYSMAGHEGHHDTGLELTPYTNIDIKEKAEEFGRGYDAGWDEGSKFHKAEKESIEDEVWEFVRNCLMMDCSDFADAFDSYSYSNFLEYSYQIAKARYEAWLKQKDEIHVGDEVAFEMAFGNGLDNNMKAVALDQATTGEEWCVLTENGCVETHDEEDLYKTGRHFDEVVELLKKMRGE
jgi:hypothetical protein